METCANHLPPPKRGQYDVIIPNLDSDEGLFFIRETPQGGQAEFAGYTCMATLGQQNPAKTCNVFRNVGDIIVAVDGIHTTPTTGFAKAVSLVQRSNRNKYTFLRMLDIVSEQLEEAEDQEEEAAETMEDEKEMLKRSIARLEKELPQKEEHVEELNRELEARQHHLDSLERKQQQSKTKGRGAKLAATRKRAEPTMASDNDKKPHAARPKSRRNINSASTATEGPQRRSARLAKKRNVSLSPIDDAAKEKNTSHRPKKARAELGSLSVAVAE